MGKYTPGQGSRTLLVLIQLLTVVTLSLWLWPWTISAFDIDIDMDISDNPKMNLNSEKVAIGPGESSRSQNIVPLSLLLSPNETLTRESLRMDKSPEAIIKMEDEVKVVVGNGRKFKFSSNSTVNEEVFEEDSPHPQIPTPEALASPPECYPVYSFDTVGPYRQEDVKTRATERIYYYRETDTNEEEATILTKDEFGLVCFTKFINCTVPPTASTASSRKTPNCVYFEKEFCTRKYAQMRWKGSVCPTTLLNPQDYKCSLRALGGSGSVEVAGSTNGKNKTLNCRNSDALCLALKPPFHTRSISDRNPPTQTMCLCPLGYTGPDCSRMDIDLFHLDLLHNIDLRNILLKYQQKDRYFIGVTLLFLLIVTLSSVLLIVAGVSFFFNYLQRKKSLILEDSPELRYASRAGSSRGESEGQVRSQGQEGHSHDPRVEIEEKEDDTGPGESHPGNENDNFRRINRGGGRRKSQRLGIVMTATAIQATQGLVRVWRSCVARCRKCRQNQGAEEGDEEYYDSDLELRFHRSRMERRQRLSHRGRVSV